MTVQYQIEYDDAGASQANAPANLPAVADARSVSEYDDGSRMIRVPSILKTALTFAAGALALAAAEMYAPANIRPSTALGTFDARVESAVKAAELSQQARFVAYEASVKLAVDQNAKQYEAATQSLLANYQASYDRTKIMAQAAAQIQGQYVQQRMNQVNAQTGAENGIINLVKLFGYGANALEAGSGDDALAYSDAMSSQVSQRLTEAAQQGARIDITGWNTGLPSPAEVQAQLARIRPVPIPPPPVLGELPVSLGAPNGSH